MACVRTPTPSDSRHFTSAAAVVGGGGGAGLRDGAAPRRWADALPANAIDNPRTKSPILRMVEV